MENTNERWQIFATVRPGGRNQIEGREKYWWISDHGRVKITTNYNESVRWPKISLTGGRPGARYAALAPNYLGQKYVHKLVAMYFCDNPLGETTGRIATVDHIDGDKLNNHYTNLQWVTMKENIRRYYRRRENGDWIAFSDREIENGMTLQEQDRIIIDYWKEGHSIVEVAEHFSMTYSRVYRPIKAYKDSK
jgi:hypothetical protein